MAYAKGQTVRLRGRFYDAGNQPTDPLGITLLVRDPRGTLASYSISQGEAIQRAGQGNYVAIIRPTISGRWSFQWSAAEAAETGSQPAAEGYFEVAPSAF